MLNTRQKSILLVLLQLPNQTEQEIANNLKTQYTLAPGINKLGPQHVRRTLKQLRRRNLVTYTTTDPHDGPRHRIWKAPTPAPQAQPRLQLELILQNHTQGVHKEPHS